MLYDQNMDFEIFHHESDHDSAPAYLYRIFLNSDVLVYIAFRNAV